MMRIEKKAGENKMKRWRLSPIVLCGLLALLIVFGVGAGTAYATGDQVWAVHYNGSISVIDSATNSVLSNYALGASNTIWDVKANPAGTRVYVADGTNGDVAILNPSNYQVIGTIGSGGLAGGMAVSSDGSTLYECMSGTDQVAVIDLRTNTITSYITVSDFPVSCTLSPDDDYLYVCCYYGNYTSIINTNTNTVVMSIAGYGPCDVVFSKDGAKAFVLCDKRYTGNAVVHVYTGADTDTPAWTADISTSHYNWFGGMDIQPDGTGVWVPNYADSSITEYSTTTYAELKTVSLASHGYVFDIRIAKTNKLYAGHGSYISVYDINTGTTTTDILTADTVKRIEVFTPSSTALNVSEQLVTFTAKTCYRTMSVSDLSVSVWDNATGRVLYAGITDSTGSVSFILNPATKYNILFNQSPNINTWYYITPSSTGYVVDIPFWQVVGLTSWASGIYTPLGEEVQWSLGVTYNSSTGAGSLTPTYNDTGTVSGVTFSLYQNATQWGGQDTLVGNYTPSESSDSWTHTYSILSATSNSYYIIITVTKPSGTFVHSTGLAYSFPGPKVLGGVFPAEWYFWIGFGCVFCLYAVGTVSKKGLFTVMAAVGGVMFTMWGWYSLVIPDTISYLAVGFTFILGIIVYLVERERFG